MLPGFCAGLTAIRGVPAKVRPGCWKWRAKRARWTGSAGRFKRKAMRFAHLSDPHLGPLPPVQLTHLLNKRAIGYVNWIRHRRKALAREVLRPLQEDLKAQRPDHILVTGDLVNLALPDEYDRALQWLADLGSGPEVTVVPGNHDAYVAGGLERAIGTWKAYLDSDVNQTKTGDIFPLLRIRGGVAFIGLSTALPTAPFMATGRVGHGQLARLAALLDETADRGLFRVVLLHHPPQAMACPAYKRLIDGEAVCALIADKGCDLILHGHTHLPSVTSLPGPSGEIPVIGVAAASQAPPERAKPASDHPPHRSRGGLVGGSSEDQSEAEGGADGGALARKAHKAHKAHRAHRAHKPPARYNLFEVVPISQQKPFKWQLSWRSRGFNQDARIEDLDGKIFGDVWT